MKTKWKKVRKEFQEELDAVVTELSIERLGDRSKDVEGVIVDVRQGKAFPSRGEFSVPLWSLRRGRGFFTYYVAHELAHLYAETGSHDERFYRWFKLICPEEFQGYEYSYKPKMAESCGVKRTVET